MNWYIIVAAVVYIAGAVQYFSVGNWKLGVSFVCYAVANMVLATL